MNTNKKHELDEILGPPDETEKVATKNPLSPLKSAEEEVNQLLLRYSGNILVSSGDYEEAEEDIRVLASIHAQRLDAKNQEIEGLQEVLKENGDKYADKGKARIPFSASSTRENIKKFGLTFDRLTKILNRAGYNDLIQAVYRLENLRKKELTEKDKQIATLRNNVKETQNLRKKLGLDFKKAEEERKNSGELHSNTLKSEPSLTPEIDMLEDELMNRLNEYSDKKTLKGHADKLRKEFKDLAYTYELMWGDQWKEARVLRKALEAKDGELIVQPVKRSGIKDAIKAHYVEAKTLINGMDRLLALTYVSPLKAGLGVPHALIIPESEKRAYAKVLIAFEKLQGLRREETKRLNREIRELKKALKEKKEQRKGSTEIWDLEDKEEAA